MVDNKSLHIAIIPDGNRRWAKERDQSPWKGHEASYDVMWNIAEWCRKSERVHTLTLWLFSTENWNRDAMEKEKLFSMLETAIQKRRKEIQKNNVRFIHSGRKDRLPASLVALIAEVEEETKDKDQFTLHIALDYGGKDEVLRAIKKNDDPSSVTDEILRNALDHPEVPDIDLIIRTSGENRTSNFFLWQSAYSEWIFEKKYFPDLTPEDMDSAVEEYDQRQRRFGS